MTSITLLTAAAAAVLLLGNVVAVGPVNTDNATPYAAMNSLGNKLVAGDLKTVLFWRNRTAAFHWSPTSAPPTATDRFSGGIVDDPTLDVPVQGISCSNSQTWLFNQEQSEANPGGKWTQFLPQGDSVAGSSNYRVCSMTTDGHYGIIFPSPPSSFSPIQQRSNNDNSNDANVKLLIDGKPVKLSLSGQLDIVASGKTFIILSPNGKCQSISQKGNIWMASEEFKHPFTDWSSNIRFSASANVFVKSDSANAQIVSLSKGSFSGLLNPKQLPVSPCGDGETCLPWVSNIDDSWILSGSWGHYLGQGTSFVRLAFPLASSNKGGGIAIAHQKLKGSFVYIGNVDGDMGNLGDKVPAPSTPASTSSLQSSQGWFVWVREDASNPKQKGFKVPLNSRSESSRNLILRTYSTLPNPLPSSWVAYEPATPLPNLKIGTQKSIPPFKLPFFKPLISGDAAPAGAWWADYLGIPQAWSLADAAGVIPAQVRIGIVDSGARMNHSGLVGNLYRKSTEVPDNGLDDENDGFVDDFNGFDFITEQGGVVDEFGHGTHCAGLLIGQDTAHHVTASAKNGKLTVIRALDQNGMSTSIDLARGLYYAIQENIEILSLSWGGGGITDALVDVFAALRASGILVFSAAGNDGVSNDPPSTPEVPKNFAGVIGVGAITETSEVASYSNFGGKSVKFLAPGDNMLSTTFDGSFGLLSGTSMACPTAVSAFSWIYGILKTRCGTSCQKSIIELQTIGLDMLCQGAKPSGSVSGKSECGIINTEASTKLALSYSF